MVFIVDMVLIKGTIFTGLLLSEGFGPAIISSCALMIVLPILLRLSEDSILLGIMAFLSLLVVT